MRRLRPLWTETRLKWNHEAKGNSHMMYLRQLFTCSLALCLGAFVWATETARKNPLDRFLEDLQSFSADFEQNIINEFGEVLETARGTVQLRRPGMFLWAYQEPYLQRIISDGAALWIFDEDLDQVTINDALRTVEDAPALIFSGDFPVSEHYVVVELDSEEDTAWIELTPRDIQSQYRRLRLGFVNNDFKSMILFDSLGQTTLFSFTNTRRNPELSRDLFQFSPPEGVDVIDSRKNGGQR